MSLWSDCRKILCIRADNIGDVIMSGPAIRALKETFGWHITLLTSSAGAVICDHMPDIDDVIVNDVPWVKTEVPANSTNVQQLVDELKSARFDGVIIFTVYSQSALPAALICLMADIPRRLAWCRENPYGLLTDWLPDPEPYGLIRHQVERDLMLAKHTGAVVNNEKLMLTYSADDWYEFLSVISTYGIAAGNPFVIIHPGVSEKKREFPKDKWTEVVKELRNRTGMPVILTGAKKESSLTRIITHAVNDPMVFSIAGELQIGALIAAVNNAALVLSVNTATAHIAAAAQVPLVVLYAATNPQHTPWQSPSSVIYFPVDEYLQSGNQVIRYATKYFPVEATLYPTTEDIVNSALQCFSSRQFDESLRPQQHVSGE